MECAVEGAMKRDGRQQRGTGTTMRDAYERQHDGFELARKSLRIWPIIWKEDQRIMVAEVVNFARGALLVKSVMCDSCVTTRREKLSFVFSKILEDLSRCSLRK